MKKKKLLNNDYCKEDLKEMIPNEIGSFCQKCKLNLVDLSELSLEEIADKHYKKTNA